MINQYNSKPCLKSKNSYHKSCWTWLKNSNRWNNLQRRLFKYSAIFVYCDIGCCFHDQTEFFEGIRRKLLRKDQQFGDNLQCVNYCDQYVEDSMEHPLLEQKNVILKEVERRSASSAGIPACSLNKIHGEVSLVSHQHIEICPHIWVMTHGGLVNGVLILKLCVFSLIFEFHQSV